MNLLSRLSFYLKYRKALILLHHVPTISKYVIGGRIRGALGACAPTKFINAHRSLVFHNRKVPC